MNAAHPSLIRKLAKFLGARKLVDFFRRKPHESAKELDVQNCSYWTNYNVANHRQFSSIADSLAFLEWRNSQYHNYIELMPVQGQDGKTVLDYGCGPGNDLVGFAAYSKPGHLVGMDISAKALDEAKCRVGLHNYVAEFIPISEQHNQIPLDAGSVDYIHSSGVVHHAVNPAKVLSEFRRVLKSSGRCRIMVYHYDCLWLHLCVAYIKMIRESAFPGLGVREAFGKMTDTTACPISRVYKPEEFVELADQCGFRTRFLGAAIAKAEVALLPERLEAMECEALDGEHRRFLAGLTFDAQGLPLHNGTFAGIDGCYELEPV